MTVQLYKTKADAEKKCREMRKFFGSNKLKCKTIKIRFDKRDGPMFGMRGFTFTANEGKTYYILADTKTEAKSWGLYSKIL